MSEVQRFWSHEASNIRCVRETDFDRVSEAHAQAEECARSLRERIAQLEESEKQMQETVDLAMRTGTRVTAERDALQELLNQRDEALHDLEQRRHAEQQACQAAERRVEELAAEVKRLDLMVSQGDYNYDADRAQFRGRIDLLEALVRDALDAFKYDPRGGCTSPPYRFVKPWAERAIAALNPTAEAASHE